MKLGGFITQRFPCKFDDWGKHQSGTFTTVLKQYRVDLMMKTLPSPLPGCLFPRCLLPLNQGRDLGWDLDRETVPGWNACRMKVATTEQPGIPYEGKVNTCHGLDLVGHMPHIQGAPRTRAPSSNSQKMDMKQRHVLTHFCRSEGALLVRLRNIPTDEIPIWS